MLTLQIILKAFESKGLKAEQFYKRDEIVNALDALTQSYFNQDILDQILSQCQQTNIKQTYRLADLSQTFIDAYNILNDKVQKSEAQIAIYKNQKKQIEGQLTLANVNTDTRYLYVTIVKIQNISPKIKYQTCYLTLILGQNMQVSKPIQHYDKLSPEFNQDYEFAIPQMITIMTIQFYITNETTTAILVGQSTLQLMTLEDSNQKEIILALKDPVGREIGTSVQIEALIVLNKQHHLQSQLQKYEQKIFQNQNDIAEYKEDIDIIAKPFLNNASKNDNRQTIFNKWSENQIRVSQQIIIDENKSQQEELLSISKAPNQISPDQQIPENMYFSSDQLNQGLIVVMIYLLLTLFVSFAKPSYLDVMQFFKQFIVQFSIFYIILFDKFDPTHLKMSGIALVASIFYDILWIREYQIWWSTSDGNNPLWGLEAINLLRFVLLFTYIQFLFKFVVCFYLYHFYKASEDPTKCYQFIVWKLDFKVGNAKKIQSWQ